MGSIIHPWNLVIFFMMTSVAVMVHSSNDKDVRAVTGDHSELRDDDTSELKHSVHSSIEEIKGLKRLTRDTTGTYTIKVHVSDETYSGSSDWYYVKVLFKSGKTWGKAQNIDPGWGFYANTEYTFEKTATYFGTNDKVAYLEVFKKYGVDDFFPKYFVVNCPDACDRYECNWQDECVNNQGPKPDFTNCFLDDEVVHVPCGIANEDARCGD